MDNIVLFEIAYFGIGWTENQAPTKEEGKQKNEAFAPLLVQCRSQIYFTGSNPILWVFGSIERIFHL